MGFLHKTRVLLWGEAAETAAERKVNNKKFDPYAWQIGPANIA